MKNVLLFFIFLSPFISFTQEVNETKDYIYTTDNSIIYGNKLEFKKPIFKKSYILLDSTRYNTNKVKFFNETKGFFANLYFMNEFSSGFAERVVEGKINLYEKWNFSPGMMTPMGGSGGGMMMTGGGSSKALYYNQGFGLLKIAKYKNLKIDLKDNPASMAFLNKYKNRNLSSVAFYVAGGVTALIGVINLYNGTKKDANPRFTEKQEKKATTVMAVGAGVMMVGSVITFGNSKNLERAVESYND